MIDVSVVVPVFNEEENFPELLERCLAACEAMGRSFELVFVDDGSSDASRSMIEEAAARHPERVIGILLNRNYGQHSAIMAGFAQARGEIVITLDADLQNPPEEIPRLVTAMAPGVDVVGSVRAHRQDTLFRRTASAMVNRMVRHYTGGDMRDYGCMLRAYRRRIVQAMLDCHERSTFIPILANTFASKTAEIEVDHAQRKAGESKYSLWKLVNLHFDLLTSMSTAPLRILSMTGALIAALGVFLGLFLLLMRLIMGPEWAVGGVFTLFALLFVFSGLQFIGMGLLGEYLGRTYSDVRARPRYIVDHIVGRKSAAKTKTQDCP
ncbi:MAG: glycosyltransferase [Deltaproteobacteria bacterium]|nr:glycosyltransferase [Deltaproteobacteria bacterium]